MAAKPIGQLVTIDRGILTDLLKRFAEAIGAVERANLRAAGVKRERACTASIFATGSPAAVCNAAP